MKCKKKNKVAKGGLISRLICCFLFVNFSYENGKRENKIVWSIKKRNRMIYNNDNVKYL